MRLLLGLLLASSLVHADEAATPFEMTWSTESYGPDGPWQAVKIGVGTPPQNIALYPGGTWGSSILTKYICQGPAVSSSCYATQAGLFNPDDSGSFDNTSISLSSKGDITNGIDAVPQYGFEKNALDDVNIGGFTVPDVTIMSVTEISQTYPGGQSYPVEMGVLSLGAPRYNTSYTENSGPPLNTTFINSYLYTNGGGKAIPSYSFGMHIGSAAQNIPGSLFLGGYDQSRAIAPVSAQPYTTPGAGGGFAIELLDIELGVVTGGSPWNFTNKTGLLMQGDSNTGALTQQPLSLLVSPPNPYIYLPKSACDTIAAELPVQYQAEMGLYYWDTSSPLYKQIVTAPTYLGFTFQLNALNTANFTIKVPFQLLNLTLQSPLVSTHTQYFPCFASTNGTYGLGRAFLQAAFVGVNWSNGGTGNWFLAQAPGPNYQATPSTMNIMPSDQSLVGSQNSWEGTWTGYWTPLPVRSNSRNGQDANSTASAAPGASSGSNNSIRSSGLSTGAKAGIGVGVGVGGLLIIGAGILFFFLRRRRMGQDYANKAEAAPQGAAPTSAAVSPAAAFSAAAGSSTAAAPAGISEFYADTTKPAAPPKPTYTLYSGLRPSRGPVELDTHSRQVHEAQ
jgi:hypothetical protein